MSGDKKASESTAQITEGVILAITLGCIAVVVFQALNIF